LPTRSVLPLAKVYDGCDDLPLFNFIKIITTDDLKWLVVSGTPGDDELKDAWDKVSLEYQELTQDTKSKQLTSLKAEIAYLTNQIFWTQSVVDQITWAYSPEWATLLNELGFRFRYEDGPELHRELEITIAQSKSLVVELEERKAELEELTKGNEKTTEAGYYVLLADIGKYMGSIINPKEVTVTQFVGIYNLYKNGNR
jgi:hypothetical protein